MTATAPTAAPSAELRKAAIVLCALPDELAARVLEHLGPDEVAALTDAVAGTHDVDRVEEQRVCVEYLNGLRRAGAPAGSERARAIIQRAFEAPEAARHLARLDAADAHGPFDFVAEVGVERVLPFLADETPATLALLCAGTPPPVAARVLLALPPALQRDVIARVATLGPVAARAADAVGAGLERRVGPAPAPVRGGVDAVRRILEAAGNAGAALRRAVEPALPALAEAAAGTPGPATLAELLARLPAETRARALGAVAPESLAKALRAAPPDLGDALLRALPAARATAVREAAARLGPVKVSEAEQALATVRGALRQALAPRRAPARAGGAR